MIVPGSFYTLDTSAKTITLTAPYNILTEEQIIRINDVTKSKVIYDSQDFNVNHSTISMAGAVITYSYANTVLENTDKLQIFANIDILECGTP